MTNMNDDNDNIENSKPASFKIPAGLIAVGRVLLIFFLMIATIFLFTFAIGYSIGSINHGTLRLNHFLVPLTSLIIAAGTIWATYKLLKSYMPGAIDRPKSPRIRKAKSMLVASMLIGTVLGVLLAIGIDGKDPTADLFNNAPVPSWLAITVILIFSTTLIFSYFWWKNIDEHEALAYKDAALWAVTFYLFATPVWWMGWRGGFLPKPEYMVIYIAVITICGLIWFVKRYA